ncbi:TolC family protein [Desulfobacula toluolica]|uniref:Predicted metal ion efflux outer membrane protein n=1 Tax=Desulfobacula toluolica (strain DSM 7467 / Tol2) TaxID=651182 RepID=K0NQF6_DESTT|nr:TolC family protein [Desulfobacula toluolica]CCK82388.1 predicted metal ion efflux outer membrane protein [Desulfobacula toluolica Tol2]
MKIKTAIMLTLGLFYMSPLYAEYSEMTRALENYTPPGYYTRALEFDEQRLDSSAESSPIDSSQDSEAVFFRIKDLKQAYEKKISNGHENFFLSDIDTKTFKRLAEIASDPEAVRQIINQKLNMHEIAVIAGLRNPAVLAAQKKIKAELESFNQVMALDETLKQYTAFTEGINNKIGPLKMKGSMKQTYPYPGLTSLKGGVIHHQVAALVEKMRIAQKTVITQTKNAYWDIVFIGQSMRSTSETLDAFDRLKDVATTLYKSGKTSFQDIIKINIKIEVLKEDLITLASKKKNFEVRLWELLNLEPDTRMGEIVLSQPDKHLPDPENLYLLARQNRQELSFVRHQIRKVKNMVEMAESMIQEPFTFSFSLYEDEAINSVGTGAPKPSFPEKTMASMKTGSPLKPWYGIDGPWLNQTRQKLLSLEQTLVQQENATDRMVREAWFEADKNKRELALYKKKILSLSQSALDVSIREYESGSIPFSQAIDSYTNLLVVQLTIAKKQTDLGRSMAALEKIVGIGF